MNNHNTSQSQTIVHNLSQQPLSQSEIKQKYITLQSILVLAEINSSYYELGNVLQKKLSWWESKYFRLKMTAFLQLTTFEPSYYQNLSAKIKQPQNGLSIYNKSNEGIKKQIKIKSKKVLKRVMDILGNKKSNFVYESFIKILKTANQCHLVKIASQKSSKIETNDSLKSKVFKRSPQKKQILRKSYSMQKSPLYKQHDYYIQVKYQPQPTIVPASNIKEKINLSNSQSFNTNPSKIHNNLQKNAMPSNRDQNSLKGNPTRKMHTSMKLNKRNEKINELESLKRKYNKLISEFNWFSQRFLKVIEEEEDVK